MTDVTLRTSSRSGDRTPEEEARSLRERLRAGTLEARWLELGAHLSYAPAALALGPESEGPSEAGAWLLGFARFGREVALRAALGLARALAPHAPPEACLPKLLPLLETWLLPMGRRRGRLARLSQGELRIQIGLAAQTALSAGLAERTAVANRTGEVGAGGLSAIAASRAGRLALAEDDAEAQSSLQDCAAAAAVLLSDEEVREAVRFELLPWTLIQLARE
ncbi:MAG TPA: hypothetical protein DEA08_36895 [Planctomycetes bacterium]|nr:hypothetical protein [Planctomycetota bacterium]